MQYNLRNLTSFKQPVSRTARFASTYFHNAIFKWNLLDDETRNSKSLFQFKHKLLEIVRPQGNSTYNICDISVVKLLTKLRMHFSALNEHRFKHALTASAQFVFVVKTMKITSIFSCIAPYTMYFVEISLTSSLMFQV